jgi:hypothetical protein
MGGPYQRSAEEGGGQTSTFPFEVWRYRYLEGIGQEIEIEFVDDCGCGAYEMTLDRSKKDALLHVPNAGLTTMEEMGQANKADRFRGGLESIGEGPFNKNNQTKQFDRMETFAKLNRAPDIKFRDLQNELVTHKFRTNLLPFDVQVDFVKLTSDTVLVPITLQVPLKGLTFANKDGIQRAVVNVALDGLLEHFPDHGNRNSRPAVDIFAGKKEAARKRPLASRLVVENEVGAAAQYDQGRNTPQ